MEIISRATSDFLSETEIWHVRSHLVGNVLRVCISAPSPRISGGQKIGAVFATDAPFLGGALVSALRCCCVSRELPPLYGVSIGYPLNDVQPHEQKRRRDLTPTHVPHLDRLATRRHGWAGELASGGAGLFLDFILQELRPALEREFPIDPTHATLCGTSLGGLFALHALFARPHSFRSYLAMSPSLWWDDKWLLQQAARQSHADAPPCPVYLCAGELEACATSPELGTIDMHGDMKAIGDLLSRWQGHASRIGVEVLAGESHNSVCLAGLSRGLRYVYRGVCSS